MLEKILLPKEVATTKLIRSSFDYAQTYDVEVDNSHYYPLGNGTISHNTLSLMFRDSVLSYGIEPAFGIYYWKRTRISGRYEYYFCVPTIVRELFKKAGLVIPMKSDTLKDTWDGSRGKPIAQFINSNLDRVGIKFKPAMQISPREKLEFMGKVMESVDSSISTTYILPEGTDWHDVYDFILEAHKRGVKSIAAFPDRKMYGIISFIPFKELAQKLLKEGVAISVQNFSEEEAKELNLTELGDTIITRHAPKRPEKLPCEIHHTSVEGKKWTVMVGLLNGKPYEVFGGLSELVSIPKKYEFGTIVKRKCDKPNAKGRTTCYDLYVGDEDDPLVIKDIVVTFDNPDYALITRLISMHLRHGIPLTYIIDQLKRDPESTVVSFNKVMARILRKYTIDEITGEPIGDGQCLSGNCE